MLDLVRHTPDVAITVGRRVSVGRGAAHRPARRGPVVALPSRPRRQDGDGLLADALVIGATKVAAFETTPLALAARPDGRETLRLSPAASSRVLDLKRDAVPFVGRPQAGPPVRLRGRNGPVWRPSPPVSPAPRDDVGGKRRVTDDKAVAPFGRGQTGHMAALPPEMGVTRPGRPRRTLASAPTSLDLPAPPGLGRRPAAKGVGTGPTSRPATNGPGTVLSPLATGPTPRLACHRVTRDIRLDAAPDTLALEGEAGLPLSSPGPSCPRPPGRPLSVPLAPLYPARGTGLDAYAPPYCLPCRRLDATDTLVPHVDVVGLAFAGLRNVVARVGL